MAARAFPLAFLLFMAPLPDSATDWLETVSKLASVETADFFFAISGEPVLRNGTIFQLSGIVLEVAQECSGIRSSWVLFIVAILASHLFLRSPCSFSAICLRSASGTSMSASIFWIVSPRSRRRVSS